MTELSNVEMKNKEINETILINLNKLFIRRGYMTSMFDNSIIKEIETNKVSNFKLEDKKFSINIMNQEIKNISSNSSSDEYLSQNLDTHKFLIVKTFSKKTYKQVNDEYVNAEVFNISELLEDIPSKNYIPEHTLINDEDRLELLETFASKDLGKIYSTDMMVRYYGGKINDIFRIKRPNISSGYSIYYRIVVQGSLDIFN